MPASKKATRGRRGAKAEAEPEVEPEQTVAIEKPAPKKRGRKVATVTAAEKQECNDGGEAADDESIEPAKAAKTTARGGRRAKNQTAAKSASSGSSGEEMVEVASIDIQTEPMETETDENVNPQAAVTAVVKKGRAKKSAATLKEEQQKRAIRKSMVLTRAQRAQLQTKN